MAEALVDYDGGMRGTSCDDHARIHNFSINHCAAKLPYTWFMNRSACCTRHPSGGLEPGGVCQEQQVILSSKHTTTPLRTVCAATMGGQLLLVCLLLQVHFGTVVAMHVCHLWIPPQVLADN
jgi:hypothetical protein